MFDLYLVEPHYILLSILLLLLLYKILASFVITNDIKNFDSIVMSSTKNPEGYKDKTMISNSFKGFIYLIYFLIKKIFSNNGK